MASSCERAIAKIAAVVLQGASLENTSIDNKHVLKTCIIASLTQHIHRLQQMLHSEGRPEENVKAMKIKLEHMDDYLMQCFGQSHAQLACETREDPCPATTDSHMTVIKKLSPVLTKDLRLEGTDILDRLLQEDVLSEAGRSSILTRPSTHAKNAAFLMFCNGCTSSQFTATVVPALKACNDEANAQLACQIERELSLPLRVVHDPNGSLCKFCSIRSKVNLRRLADVMYKMNAISDQQREDLSSPNLSHDIKWKQLSKMKRPKWFAFSLKKKYPEVYRDVRWTPFSALCCSCEDVSTTVNTHEETDNGAKQHRLMKMGKSRMVNRPTVQRNITQPLNSRLVTGVKRACHVCETPTQCVSHVERYLENTEKTTVFQRVKQCCADFFKIGKTSMEHRSQSLRGQRVTQPGCSWMVNGVKPIRHT